ncbi:2Fe-2S iron-sulfur cluster-binding protein [Halegenticoccus tardaugens]|uniref:2Fe-2S iron-sulfur cluster-binding protein n=1 Tax=Halegenticoccus tardaugens TaxID=2071624 RepID=UPI00100A8B29|nr:2Fe-2S iron-sulfur cluster-binding protein [Halegenticoccus tardaugens]
MPTVTFRGKRIECEDDVVLRDALLAAGESPHNGRSKRLNCRGHATCGTCAVAVDGPVSEMGARERRRLSLPPHSLDSGLRLSCQTRVRGDLTVTKGGGFWGQDLDE